MYHLKKAHHMNTESIHARCVSFSTTKNLFYAHLYMYKCIGSLCMVIFGSLVHGYFTHSICRVTLHGYFWVKKYWLFYAHPYICRVTYLVGSLSGSRNTGYFYAHLYIYRVHT